METHSCSKGDPTRPIGSKLKKGHPAVKDAACTVAHDSSGVKEQSDTTAIAVPTGIGSNKNDNKMLEELEAPAVHTGSSGNDELGKLGDAIVLPTTNPDDNNNKINALLCPYSDSILLLTPMELLLLLLSLML
jgi:hypothetical protein